MTSTSDDAGWRIQSDTAERDFYRMLVESVQTYAIFGIDPDGIVLTWSDGARKLKGYTSSEILGKHFSIFYPPEDIAAKKPDHELAIAALMGQYGEEGWRLRKDGSRFWASVLITAVHDEEGHLLAFAKVTRDLTERHESEQRVLDALRESDRRRAEAELAVRQRDEMLSIVSHDLRNPLATISMSASLLREPEGALPEEEHAQHLEIISRSARHMNWLIQDLLDVARVEGGRFRISMRREDAGALALEACAAFRPQMSAKELTLNCEIDQQLPPVSVDRERIIQVLSNFLSNAVKFTPANGRITVRADVSNDGDEAQLAVSDTGPGIDRADLPHIFDRYWQARITAHLGSGLGLAVAKGIAEAHGGRVSVESERGLGSTFMLSIPISKEPRDDGKAIA